MSGRVQDKVAFVSGAGSVGQGWGNGKACAVLYAREGAAIFAVDINEAAAQETARLIEEAGGRARVGVGDISEDSEVARLVRECHEAFGHIDILHNNVATTIVGSATDLSVADWDRSTDVNLRSAFLACRHVLPGMMERRSGSIISIASVAAWRYLGVPYTAYYATKAGLVQLMRTVAIEYAAYGIRANSILPGFIDTPHVHAALADHLGAGDHSALVAKRGRQTPLGRMGSAWDVAYAALYLASDEAGYVTATELVVDGGVSAVAA